MNQQQLIEAVIRTLKYSDHFDYPLTFAELSVRLVKVRLSKPALKKLLQNLEKSKKIIKTNGSYHLPNRQAIVKIKQSRRNPSQQLFQKAKHLAHKLSIFPSVMGVFLTGSLAVGNAHAGDDIDLLIITKPGLLWTTRLFLTLYTTILGLRRTPGSTSIKGKLCLNLYLTTNSLAIPTSKHSLYTAYELIQVVPLYDPHRIHPQLLRSNTWISDYLPNYLVPRSTPAIYHEPSTTYQKIFEKIAYTLQYLYMQPKITREYITADAAFFHPHDPSRSLSAKIKL